MNVISFMSANCVARQVGYHMTGGWDQGDKAANDYFRPLETYRERLDEMLKDLALEAAVGGGRAPRDRA